MNWSPISFVFEALGDDPLPAVFIFLVDEIPIFINAFDDVSEELG